MRLCIRLLQQRQPRLVLVHALREIQSPRPRLPRLAVLLLCIGAVDIVPDGAFVDRLIVVGRAQVELVVYDALLPFPVYAVSLS